MKNNSYITPLNEKDQNDMDLVKSI